MLGMDSEGRATFPELMGDTLRPAELSEDTPPTVWADWYEERGMDAEVAIIREGIARQ